MQWMRDKWRFNRRLKLIGDWLSGDLSSVGATGPLSVSFRITLSDLEWLGEIFNNTKQQLKFLLFPLGWCLLGFCFIVPPQHLYICYIVRCSWALFSGTYLVVYDDNDGDGDPSAVVSCIRVPSQGNIKQCVLKSSFLYTLGLLIWTNNK